MTVAALPRTRRQAIPPPPDPVTQYALDVTAGRIVVGAFVRKACQRHLRDLSDGAARGLRFDPKAAMRPIEFAHMLRHYKGEWGPRPANPRGDLIVLQGWQEFLIGAAFGWKRADGTRRFRSIYLEVAKKNGKTLLAAIIAILLAFFDGEPGAEVYSVATKRDQAKLSWNDAVQLVRRNPDLARRLETLALTLTDISTASFFRPLGRDADSDQGINPNGAIVDELHVLADRDSIDNVETATSARRQPMVVKITTAGVKRESVWAHERADALAVVEGRATDDSMLVLIYTLDEGDDPFDEAVWPKANPNLGVSVKLDTLREQAAKARRNPGAMGAYLRYRMNVPTQTDSYGIDIDAWDLNPSLEGDPGELAGFRFAHLPEAGRRGYAALDLATTRDLSAFVALLPADEGFVDLVPLFWCPDRGIEERSERDGVPYLEWRRLGLLKATEGNVTDYDVIRADIAAVGQRFQLDELGYDPWNATQLVTQLQQDGATVVAIPQGFAHLSAATREMERLVYDRKLRGADHPILRWMAGNVTFVEGPNEAVRPSKDRSEERIDGIVTLVMAIRQWQAHLEPTPSVYEERGLIEV